MAPFARTGPSARTGAFDRRRWTPVLVVVVLVLVWWLQPRGILAPDAGTPSAGAPPAEAPPADAPSAGRAAGRPRTAPARYDPKSALPVAAIPGGGLARHEGRGGAHTLARHVGRSLDDLQARARAEAKREVSTFPDEATADRAVAGVLYRKRAAIAAWLTRGPDGLEDFQATLDANVGTIWRADRGRAQPGRTVIVVLAASDVFPEGFRIHTAYVTLP